MFPLYVYSVLTPCPNWHWQLKKVQRVLTIKSSFSCIRLSYFHWIECFWWVLFEIMQNLHLLRLPKSAYFYLVSKSDIDRPSKRTHQNSSILWKLLSPMHEKELWVVKTLWTFFSCQCQFGHGVKWKATVCLHDVECKQGLSLDESLRIPPFTSRTEVK